MTFADKACAVFKGKKVVIHLVSGRNVSGELGSCGEGWMQITSPQGTEVIVNSDNVLYIEAGSSHYKGIPL